MKQGGTRGLAVFSISAIVPSCDLALPFYMNGNRTVIVRTVFEYEKHLTIVLLLISTHLINIKFATVLSSI
jgi:hypothetical protein